ncbi:hypothetical protein HanIR_Chr14g0717161 [Helianthus annuus]|nr:hypothetical protein HanIR_Chr14g0717161 [Helianthus annuus]
MFRSFLSFRSKNETICICVPKGSFLLPFSSNWQIRLEISVNLSLFYPFPNLHVYIKGIMVILSVFYIIYKRQFHIYP